MGEGFYGSTSDFISVGNGSSETIRGDLSISAGAQAAAKGYASIAVGHSSVTEVDASNSAAFGRATVSGVNSIASGFDSVASGNNAVAFSGGLSAGHSSLALGPNSSTSPTAWGATALGDSTVNGSYSFAQGGGIAVGDRSASFSGSSTLGLGSFSQGEDTIAVGQHTAVFGKYNDTGGDDTWNTNANPALPHPNGDLFVIGNGTDDQNRANAFVVKSNGDVIISKPQGDISMGAYQ